MRASVDRETERLDRQGAAVVRNGDRVLAPQQNANLRRPLVRDVTDDILQQPCWWESIRVFVPIYMPAAVEPFRVLRGW